MQQPANRKPMSEGAWNCVREAEVGTPNFWRLGLGPKQESPSIHQFFVAPWKGQVAHTIVVCDDGR
jgi:hypothetical protein